MPNGEWSGPLPVKGVTTILGDTLEKKGLMTWPLGLALKELFGFYDFTNENGQRLTGFSKAKGTLRTRVIDGDNDLLPFVISASKAWQRKQKSGADVGSLVHDAIEQYVKGHEFPLTIEKYKEGQTFDTEAAEAVWLQTAAGELKMAQLAFDQFKLWWVVKSPKLIAAEEIVFSKQDEYCGAFDALLEIKPEHHPVYTDWDRDILVMEDHKTANASDAGGAPQGVYYSYFIQSAAYAAAWEEMGNGLVDDLLIVSARKDGSFDTVYASQVGLSVADAISWWRAVVRCYRLMEQTKRGLVKLASDELTVGSIPYEQLKEK